MDVRQDRMAPLSDRDGFAASSAVSPVGRTVAASAIAANWTRICGGGVVRFGDATREAPVRTEPHQSLTLPAPDAAGFDDQCPRFAYFCERGRRVTGF
jgi:hypothetical protein